MDVQIENAPKGGPGGLVRQMRVRIPADRLAQALDDRLKTIATRARIPGFRPGKAPLKVVQAQYGDSARLEVIQELVRGSYPEAVDKAGVHPASAPSFEVVTEKAGEPLEYVARFEVYPEIRLQGLDALKVEHPVVEVAAGDVDKVIESMRRSRRELVPVTRPAQTGDICTLDFEGFVDGAAFPGGKGENTELELGQGRFIADLENGIAGHGAGESFTVDVKFPDDYRSEALKGKAAQFKVALKDVKEPKLPELGAEFLKAHGVDEAAGVEGLRTKVRAALEAERDKGIKNRMKQQVLDQLLAANPIDVPQAMVASETERMRDEAVARFNAGQMKPEQKQKLFPDEMLAPGARRRVALGLLIGEVIRARKIVLDATRIERLIDELAAEYQQPEQVKQYYRGRPEMMQGLRAIVLEEQVVESLLAGTTPRDVPMSLDDLLRPAGQSSP